MKTVQTSVRQAYPARCVTHAKGAKKEAFLQVKKRKGLKKQKLKINLTASPKKLLQLKFIKKQQKQEERERDGD